MASSRALLEVAPTVSYLTSNIAQDDVVMRAESALRTLHLGAGSNLPLRISAGGVYVAGTLTAASYSNVPVSAAATFGSNAGAWASNAIALEGFTSGPSDPYADLSMAGIGFTSSTVAAPTPTLTKTLDVGGRVVGNQLRLVAGNGDGPTALRTATARRTQYLLSNLYPALWAASARNSLALQ